MNIKELLHNAMVELGIIKREVVDAVKHDVPKIVSFFGKLIDELPKIKSIVDNPGVDAIAALIIGHPLEEAIKNGIDWAIDKFTKGSIIQKDIAAATTLEEKIKVLLIDLLKYEPEIQKMKIGDIAALVVKYIGGDQLSINTATQLIEAEIASLQKHK